MNNDLNYYQENSVDWRALARKNRTRAYITIGIFFLIYGCLGLLFDAFFLGIQMLNSEYPDMHLNFLVKFLINLEPFPVATLVLLIIAAISLWITLTYHDELMLIGTEAREIRPETTSNLEEQQLYNIIDELRIASSLKFMPKVFIINATYMNAFSSGYSEKSSMVAITSGLLEKLDRAETQAVMAHEISHIRNMDIRLILIGSVLSNLILITFDYFFYSRYFGSWNPKEGYKPVLKLVLPLRHSLSFCTNLLTLYLSRAREYMADAGCVELIRDNQPLAQALLKIQADTENNAEDRAQEYARTPHEEVRWAAYIFAPPETDINSHSFSSLSSTHPSIEERLAAIGFKKR